MVLSGFLVKERAEATGLAGGGFVRVGSGPPETRRHIALQIHLQNERRAPLLRFGDG